MNTVPTLVETKIPPLNIRIRADQRRLIEQAAEAMDKTVSDFVREAALREATHTLLDQALFQLNQADWDKFNDALNHPPTTNPGIHDLLTRKPVWGQ